MNIILLDNFDSFTYNLVDQFRSFGFDVTIYRNDVNPQFISQQLLKNQADTALVLSPGPGTPHEAGCMMSLLNLVVGKVPILGICLGHQALVEYYGGKVCKAPQVVHGKSSLLSHSGEGIFDGLRSPLPVARYHSLVAVAVPNSLEVIATSDSLTMAIHQLEDNVIGFQFHPESILTTAGQQLLIQTLCYLRQASNDSTINRLVI